MCIYIFLYSHTTSLTMIALLRCWASTLLCTCDACFWRLDVFVFSQACINMSLSLSLGLFLLWQMVHIAAVGHAVRKCLCVHLLSYVYFSRFSPKLLLSLSLCLRLSRFFCQKESPFLLSAMCRDVWQTLITAMKVLGKSKTLV